MYFSIGVKSQKFVNSLQVDLCPPTNMLIKIKIHQKKKKMVKANARYAMFCRIFTFSFQYINTFMIEIRNKA